MSRSRLAAVALAGTIVLVGSACSDSRDGDALGTDLELSTTTSEAPVGGGESGGGGGEAPSPPREGRPGAGSGGSSGGGGTNTGGGGGGAGSPAMPSERGAPGTFAPAYLRPDLSEQVVIELHSQDGASLRESSINHLVSRLDQVTGKGILVDAGGAFSDGRRQWSASDIRAVADARARVPHGGGKAVMRVLLLRGEFERDDVLGVAVRGAVAAIFVDQVQRAAGPIAGSREIEKAIVLHEAGHLLGLVDLYLQTGRQDPEHPGHSPNRASVMYWAVERTLVGELLGSGPPTEFDQQDRQDLAAIANGAAQGSAG